MLSTAIYSAIRPSPPNSESERLRAAISRRIASRSRDWSMSVRLAEALAQEVAADVAGEREQHQGQARREDRLVADRAVRQAAAGDLDEKCRDAGAGRERGEGELRRHSAA